MPGPGAFPAAAFRRIGLQQREAPFREHLLTYVPLAAHMRRVLDGRPGHKAPIRRFQEELEDFMSEADAQRSLRAIVSWGRYAEALRPRQSQRPVLARRSGLTQAAKKKTPRQAAGSSSNPLRAACARSAAYCAAGAGAAAGCAAGSFAATLSLIGR